MRLRILAVLTGLILALGAGLSPAIAQDKPRTLLDLFFGRNEPKAAAPVRKTPTKTTVRKTAPRSTSNAAASGGQSTAAEPDLAPVEKLDNARVVLVVGDFMASGVAGGLTDAFERLPGVRVVDASNGSSGLVRDDYFSWPEQLGALIDTNAPAAVVVMLGANDRQQLVVDGKRESVLSDAWAREYRSRVNAIASLVEARKIPLVWIGQVPFRQSSMTTDMLAFNDIYRQAADNARLGAAYVDIWEGFVDENGAFVERGPDINGQRVALRSGAVNVTKAGYRKIAFYAEKPLSRILGDALSADITALSTENLPTLSLSLPETVPTAVPIAPVDLKAIGIGDTATLAGATITTPTPPSPPGVATTGRIDDFRLPPRQ